MHRAVFLIAVIVLGVLTYLTRQRNDVWRDPFLLWQDAAEKSPLKARPLNNLAVEYRKRGDIERAIDYFSRASAAPHDPQNARGFARANLALMYLKEGQVQVAFAIVNQVLQETPSFDAMNLMALILLIDGQPLEALQLTDEILKRNSNYEVSPSLHLTRGQAFQALANCKEANWEYVIVQTLSPGTVVPVCGADVN